MKYIVAISTINTIEVDAASETAALEIVEKQILSQNPRQLFYLQIAEEAELNPIIKEEEKIEENENNEEPTN